MGVENEVYDNYYWRRYGLSFERQEIHTLFTLFMKTKCLDSGGQNKPGENYTLRTCGLSKCLM